MLGPPPQSAYYRKWSKPADRAVKLSLDAVMKEANRGLKRRFLLTGPPQVSLSNTCIHVYRRDQCAVY